MKQYFKLFTTKTLAFGCIATLAFTSANSNAAAKINDKLSIGGELWTELDVNFTSNNSSMSYGVDRALLSTTYKLDGNYEMDFSLFATSSTAVLVEGAYLTRSAGNGKFQIGYLHDDYISWLNDATGLRWVNASLTQSFRNRRALGANYEHNFGEDGLLSITAQNGNDDALGAGGADSSMNFTAAYKAALNEDLDGQAFFSFQNKDGDSANSANAVVGFGAAIAGGSDTFKFLGEFALLKAQVNGSSARLGFGATATYAFRPMHHFYGRFYSGNKASQDAAGIKQAFEIGLLKDINKSVSGGVLGEFSKTTTDTTNSNVKVRLAAKF
ncbi:hypothetical protein GW916_09620 [bacterium]|nr:hypothetical protein [bacterium]